MDSHCPEVTIAPEEYERTVLKWIKHASANLDVIKLAHRELMSGISGQFEIDIVLELRILDEAILKIIVECKRYKRPVERDVVLALHC